MTEKNPVFRVVKDSDIPINGDVPYLEFIPGSASSETRTNEAHTSTKPRPGLTVVQKSADSSDAGHSQASNEQPGMLGQYNAERYFWGYPPLPALVIGLFLLVFMLLGD